jgi:hypothetical protein
MRRIQVQLERKRTQKMMMWRMRPICLHPELLSMAEERALLVAELVAVELHKLKRKKRKKRRRKKKLLMWRKSLQPPMCTWEI